MNELESTNKRTALQSIADRLQITSSVLKTTLQKTAFKECKTEEAFITAVVVSNTYQLNPMLKEIYAFPARDGGIIPMVSIDGWISLVNRQDNFDGVDFEYSFNEETKALENITAIFYLKNRTHPIKVTEYMDECYDKNKETWRRWPTRMLRHKAYIQGARMAFGFSGIVDPDEKERIIEAQTVQEKNNIPETSIDAILEEKPKKEKNEKKKVEVEKNIDIDDLISD